MEPVTAVRYVKSGVELGGMICKALLLYLHSNKLECVFYLNASLSGQNNLSVQVARELRLNTRGTPGCSPDGDHINKIQKRIYILIISMLLIFSIAFLYFKPFGIACIMCFLTTSFIRHPKIIDSIKIGS